jgi:acyl-ACP thioesterase
LLTQLWRAVAIAPRIERTYRVRFDEAGADGHLRASGFLRYAQDLAWIHSESAGFGRQWYAERGLTWLARCVELEIIGAVEYGAEVTVSTEVVGFRRVWARRRTEFREHATERTLGAGITDWVLLNSRGIPVRPPADVLDGFPVTGGDFTPLRLDLPDAIADSDGTQRDFSPLLSDVDPYGHVNNAAYLDYVDEHLAAIGRRADIRHCPRRYRGEFMAPAEPGMALSGVGWETDKGWFYLLRAGDREVFRGRFDGSDSNWVGG